MKFLSLGIILLCISINVSFSQTIDEVLSRYYSSSGGKEKHTKIKTLHMTIERSNPRSLSSPSVIQTIYIKYPKKYYYEESIDSSSRIRVISEHGAWIKYNKTVDSIINSKAKREIENLIETSMFERDRIEWPSKYTELQLLPSDSVKDRVSFVINSKAVKPLDDCLYYIDKETFQLIKKQFVFHAPDGYDHNCEIFYSDFESIDGYMIARKREIFYDSIPCEVYILKNIEIDRPIDELIFHKPE